MAVILPFHAVKAVVRIAAVQIPIDYLRDVRPPETLLPGEMLIIHPLSYILMKIPTESVTQR